MKSAKEINTKSQILLNKIAPQTQVIGNCQYSKTDSAENEVIDRPTCIKFR